MEDDRVGEVGVDWRTSEFGRTGDWYWLIEITASEEEATKLSPPGTVHFIILILRNKSIKIEQ
jgi:hypothetical protein